MKNESGKKYKFFLLLMKCKPTRQPHGTAWVSATAQAQRFTAPCGVAPVFSVMLFVSTHLQHIPILFLMN
jgi:hypothetical protein